MIETAPLEQAADVYARMMQGKARFRMVLTIAHLAARRMDFSDAFVRAFFHASENWRQQLLNATLDPPLL